MGGHVKADEEFHIVGLLINGRSGETFRQKQGCGTQHNNPDNNHDDHEHQGAWTKPRLGLA